MANRRQPATISQPSGPRPASGGPVLDAPRPAATRTQHLLERDIARLGEPVDPIRPGARLHTAAGPGGPGGPVGESVDRRWLDVGLAIAVSLAAFVLYAATAARYPVTGDTPELIAVANIFGVAHAPGYPLLTMTGHLFGLIPIGSYALRTSLFSAAGSAACVGLVYATVRRLTPHRTGALTAALALALTPVYWQWSLQFEVFGLANLLATTITYLLVRWCQAPRRSGFLIGAAFAFGLALTNQQTIIFALPAFLWLVWLRRRELFAAPRLLVYGALAALAGLLPYVYVPIAAARQPALSWDDANWAGSFYRLITRAGYGSKFELVADGGLSGGNPIVRFGYLLAGVGLVVGVLAIIGAVRAYRVQRWYFWFTVIAFAVAGALFQIPANINLESSDTALFVLERFFLLPLVLIAPLAGSGSISWANGSVRGRAGVRK